MPCYKSLRQYTLTLKLRLNLIITALLLVVMFAGAFLSLNNARQNAHAEVISDGRRDIETGTAVEVRTGADATVSKNILPMVGTEGPAVLPLSEGSPSPVVNGNPASLQDGLS